MTERKKKRERLPTSVSSAVFIEDEQGRLLLLQQAAEWKGGKWGPPAGGIHAHEDPIDTVIRETREEIGVGIELVNMVGIYTADRGDSRSGIAFVFRAKIKSGEVRPREGEIADYRFFAPDEIKQLIVEGNLYKPEYNLSGIKDWLDARSYPLDVVKRLEAKG